jgi:hypothetical protein
MVGVSAQRALRYVGGVSERPAADRVGLDGGRPVCRNIKRLRYPDRPTTTDECREAALQYVRKVSGFRAPSKRNEAAFDAAVARIAAETTRLLVGLTVRGERVQVDHAPTHLEGERPR